MIKNASTSLYTGKLTLTGIPQGPVTITVFAKDVLGNNATATRGYVFDSYPTIIIYSPVKFASFQNGTVHVKIR